MPTQYIVQPGDTLSKIAASFGLQSWRDVYFDPSNATFRRMRPNPDRIFPNDVLMIPDGADPPTDGRAVCLCYKVAGGMTVEGPSNADLRRFFRDAAEDPDPAKKQEVQRLYNAATNDLGDAASKAVRLAQALTTRGLTEDEINLVAVLDRYLKPPSIPLDAPTGPVVRASLLLQAAKILTSAKNLRTSKGTLPPLRVMQQQKFTGRFKSLADSFMGEADEGIRVFPTFFNETEFPKACRHLTLMHERFHLVGVRHGDTPNDDDDFDAILNFVQALNSADCLSAFVIDLVAGGVNDGTLSCMAGRAVQEVE
jgi:hypothetical protein